MRALCAFQHCDLLVVWLFLNRVRQHRSDRLKARLLFMETLAHAQTCDRCVLCRSALKLIHDTLFILDLLFKIFFRRN